MRESLRDSEHRPLDHLDVRDVYQAAQDRHGMSLGLCLIRDELTLQGFGQTAAQECRSIDQAETWRPELGDRIDERISSKALAGDWQISTGPLAVSFVSDGVYFGS